MTPMYFRHRLRKKTTGEYVLVKHQGQDILSPLGEGSHLFKTDLFGITRAIVHADETYFERIGDVELWGPINQSS